jgi:hypothetical protein
MTLTTTITTDDAFDFVSATEPGVGLCGGTVGVPDCTTNGYLISNDELKTEFRNRDFIKNSVALDKQLMIGKEQGSSSSVYACFIPLSKSVREKACVDGKVYTLAAGGERLAITAGDASCAASSTTWTSGPQYVCIPE